jgi:hypothetical protein
MVQLLPILAANVPAMAEFVRVRQSILKFQQV